MVAKSLYMFLILIIIISVLLGSTTVSTSTVEKFDISPHPNTSNQYVTEFRINRNVINSNLYNMSILKNQDPNVYSFESNILLGEERSYNTDVYNCLEVWSNWSNCDRSNMVCDGYSTSIISTRKRTLLSRIPARNGGTPCESDTMMCTFENVCPVVNTLSYCTAEAGNNHCLVTNGGIYLDGGLYNRNFIDKGDTCILALSLWKENDAYWTGMVGIGNGGNHSFVQISTSGGIDLKGQTVSGYNNIVITPKCEKYRAVILVSKNDIEKVSYTTYRIYSDFFAGFVFAVNMNNDRNLGLLGRNFVNGRDVCILAFTMWTDTGKSWTGFVGINHIFYKGNQTFIELWNNNVSISQRWGAFDLCFVIFNGVNFNDGGVYYRANVLISKNDFNDIKYKTYTAEWRVLSFGFVIDMRNMFGRNLVENKDQIIIAIVIWTSSLKGWSGFVSINNGVKPGNQAFKEIWSSGLTLSSSGQDFIVISGVDSSETVYYRANILNSKNKIQPS